MDALPPIRQIIKQYGLAAKKELGQNFLFDQNLTDKMVRCAGDLQGKTVIEVGPGPGILTRSLLQSNASHIIAIEKDPKCYAALEDYLVPHAKDRLTLLQADALTCELATVTDTPATIIANLPYNIGTALLLDWFRQRAQVESITVMLQKEVVDRLVAVPNTKAYGRLSIKAQWLCDVSHQFDVPSSAFYPPPKVNSSIVHLVPKKNPIVVDEVALEQLCQYVFSKRRKMLKASLKSLSDNPVELLKKADIDPTLRPESLKIEQFCRLTNHIKKTAM